MHWYSMCILLLTEICSLTRALRYTVLKMAAEYIFLSADPTFNLALFILIEFRDANRMDVQSQSSVKITNIESNADRDDNRFCFGGGRSSPTAAFSRTAGAVFRMCMLRTTNIPRRLWPDQNPIMKRRNTTKMAYEQNYGDRFTLTDQEDTARRYWSKYDQLYPHYVIEDKIKRVGLGRQAALPSMMLIFRNNFQEVIEIKTTANATRQVNHFDSDVHVLVTVQTIKPGEDGNCFKWLKHIINGAASDYRALHNGVEALNQVMGELNLSDSDPDEDQGDED